MNLNVFLIGSNYHSYIRLVITVIVKDYTHFRSIIAFKIESGDGALLPLDNYFGEPVRCMAWNYLK